MWRVLEDKHNVCAWHFDYPFGARDILGASPSRRFIACVSLISLVGFNGKNCFVHNVGWCERANIWLYHRFMNHFFFLFPSYSYHSMRSLPRWMRLVVSTRNRTQQLFPRKPWLFQTLNKGFRFTALGKKALGHNAAQWCVVWYVDKITMKAATMNGKP